MRLLLTTLATFVLAGGLLFVPFDAAGQVEVPADANFVASSRGQVYYWVGCAGWRSLSVANLRFFAARIEAEAAGYRISGQRGCEGPASLPKGATIPESADAESPAPGVSVVCTVSAVVDGDTVDCADSRRVRLILVDAPESNQGPFGSMARSALAELLPIGTEVSLEMDVDPMGPYGRVLAYVILPDGRMVNEELLRQGMAVVAVYPPNTRHLDRLRKVAEEAEAEGRGLWAVGGFRCLPSSFRTGTCPPR